MKIRPLYHVNLITAVREIHLGIKTCRKLLTVAETSRTPANTIYTLRTLTSFFIRLLSPVIATIKIMLIICLQSVTTPGCALLCFATTEIRAQLSVQTAVMWLRHSNSNLNCSSVYVWKQASLSCIRIPKLHRH